MNGMMLQHATNPDERPTVSTERIDDIPLLIAWLMRMQVHVIIDRVLGPPHGNWKGLTYGQLALLFVTYMVSRRTHFLNPMEEWARTHGTTLSQALGTTVRPEDCTDDRLATLLERLGDESVGPETEQQLGQHILRAYRLPTDTARIDMSTVSGYHDRAGETDKGLLQLGHSKDYRPDLRQFKLVLATLDPGAIPLAMATLSGEQTDDRNYIPTWKQLVATIGHPGFLVVGDCKLGSLENRATIADGKGTYLCPLPMSGHTPKEIEQWVLDPIHRPRPIRLAQSKDDDEDNEPIAEGFEVSIECSWQDPTTKVKVRWTERRLLVRSYAHADSQNRGLLKRLEKADKELARLAKKDWESLEQLKKAAESIVQNRDVSGYFQVQCTQRVEQTPRYVGRGRPGKNSVAETIDKTVWGVEVKRDQNAIGRFETLAGWRQYATNAKASALSLTAAVQHYRGQWQPERGFSRLKGGILALRPMFIQSDARIIGLVLLSMIALRLITLIEFVVRRGLFGNDQESLAGLYPSNPGRKTSSPTTERLLDVFEGVTLHRIENHGEVWVQVTPLSPLQRRIVQLMELPEDIYDLPSPVAAIADG